VALAAGKALLRQPVKHRHHRRVRQVTVGQAQANLANGQRLCALPEHVHDGTLKLTQPVHGVTLSAVPKPEKYRAGPAQTRLLPPGHPELVSACSRLVRPLMAWESPSRRRSPDSTVSAIERLPSVTACSVSASVVRAVSGRSAVPRRTRT